MQEKMTKHGLSIYSQCSPHQCVAVVPDGEDVRWKFSNLLVPGLSITKLSLFAYFHFLSLFLPFCFDICFACKA